MLYLIRRSYFQDLYRYAGDSSTCYYKAVKGWQDASRMKEEVRKFLLIPFKDPDSSTWLPVEHQLRDTRVGPLATFRYPKRV